MQRADYPTLINFMRDTPSGSAFVFVNFCGGCTTVATAIEELLIQAKMDIDLLMINGDMDKKEKFAIIRLFTGAISMEDFTARILIVTAAANIRIDKETIEMVF